MTRSWLLTCSQKKPTGCRASLLYIHLSFIHTSYLGFAGFHARLTTSAAACPRVSVTPWKNYQRALMQLTSASYKTSIKQTGNWHTFSSKLLQWHPAHFVSRSLRSFSHLILTRGQVQTFELVGALIIRRMLCCLRVQVYLPLSKSVLSQLYSFPTFP